ncbi:hypothetical protein FQN57_001141 [Myotisia sp. PD_48]|nr:hypothetical protein FQN57_001141 [Myotisia sp. PD_48]
MAGVYGPTLPSKRKLEEDDDTTPSRTPSTSSHPSRPAEAEPPKRARVIGPALPPTHTQERSKDSDESDESDDDYGPSLPPPAGSNNRDVSDAPTSPSIATIPVEETAKRDEWMLKPPDQLDFSSRAVDPTKLRSRKFKTGPGATRPSGLGGSSSTWTETTEEKRKRLENEVMGIQAPASVASSSEQSGAKAAYSERSEAMAKQVQEYNERNRTKSLYSQHQKGSDPREKEDDPSARAFDKEKDIRAGSKINSAQRREFLNKASDFGSRFAGGKFL